MTNGERIKYLREKNGLTQKDIATRYQELAKSQKASKEDVSSILIPLILVIIFLFIMFISFIGYMS